MGNLNVLTMDEQRKIRFNVARTLHTMQNAVQLESVGKVAGIDKEIYVKYKNCYKYKVLVSGVRVKEIALVV